VQLVDVDRTTLEVLEMKLNKVADSALSYFARVNDLFFFPEEDSNASWSNLDLTNPTNLDKVVFRIKAQSYSTIGTGQHFQVDLGTATFIPIGSYGAELDDDNEGNGGCDDDCGSLLSEDSYDTIQGEIEDNWATAIDVDADLDVDRLSDYDSDRSDSEDEIEEALDADRLMEPPTEGSYENFLGGTRILLHQKWGELLPVQEHKKRETRNSEEGNESVKIKKSILARGIRMAEDLINEEVIKVRDVTDEDQDGYKEAIAWAKEQSKPILSLQQGWARRADENLYGPSYATKAFDKFIIELVDLGNQESSMKKSPSQASEEWQRKNPGRYCLPGDSECSKKINGLITKYKGGKALELRQPKVSKEIEDDLIAILDDNFWNLTGVPAETLLSKKYGGRRPEGYNAQDIRQRVNALRSARKQKVARQAKRELCD
jgi:hypothetical protein